MAHSFSLLPFYEQVAMSTVHESKTNQEGVVSRSCLHNLLMIEVNSLSLDLFLAQHSRTLMQKLCCCGYHRTQAMKASFDKK